MGFRIILTPSRLLGLLLGLLLLSIAGILYLDQLPPGTLLKAGDTGAGRGDAIAEVYKLQTIPITSDANANGLFDRRRVYQVYWHSPLGFLKFHPQILYTTNFSTCQLSNCNLTFSKDSATTSDAVLIDGRIVHKRPDFERPVGQIWVLAAQEASWSFKVYGRWWNKPPWKSAFNWTMTYDKTNSDIYLPYGEIKQRGSVQKRNFTALALQKTKGGLIISSHCPTPGKREKYLRKLKNFISIEHLGRCGKPWKCGKQFVHDECFNLLNTSFKFYLAFENALCRQYVTEKFYDNFNYDTIMVVRGGLPGSPHEFLPKGAYIDTDSFRSVEELGKYLLKLSSNPEEYAALLEAKSRYYSTGSRAVYQRALCDLCERLNKQAEYHKEILDIEKWVYKDEPCREPLDLD